MEIIKDKDLIWDTDNYDVILVGTSIYNMLTQGFQSKMYVKYPHIMEPNNSTPYADQRKYGKRITIESINNSPIISLMYICGYPHSKRDYLNYEALENCLLTAAVEFKGKKIAMPIVGSSQFDGNGDKDRCLSIIEKTLGNSDVTVYDFQQFNRRKEIANLLSQFNVYLQNKDWKVYNELKKNKDKIIKKHYLRH
jgi:hypothetical protein